MQKASTLTFRHLHPCTSAQNFWIVVRPTRCPRLRALLSCMPFNPLVHHSAPSDRIHQLGRHNTPGKRHSVCPELLRNHDHPSRMSVREAHRETIGLPRLFPPHPTPATQSPTDILGHGIGNSASGHKANTLALKHWLRSCATGRIPMHSFMQQPGLIHTRNLVSDVVYPILAQEILCLNLTMVVLVTKASRNLPDPARTPNAIPSLLGAVKITILHRKLLQC
jgi:hypothetical protein